LLATLNPHGGRVGSPALLSGGGSIAADLVPFIDKRYRTLADRDHRAVAGLSSSGAASFHGAMSNLRIFGSVGLFSGGLPALPGVWLAVPTPANAAQFFVGGPDINQSADMDQVAALLPGMDSKARLRLLYLAVGTNDPLLNTQRLLTTLLDKRGVKYLSLEVPNNRHDWRFWRWCLADFAPRLFR
jgi:enterochelin esterase-like enzyme